MNRIILVIFVSFSFFSCRSDKGMTLSDFADLEQLEAVQLEDDISKYYLSNEQMLDFIADIGQLSPALSEKIDTAQVIGSVKFNGKSYPIKTSSNGELIEIPSAWITKNQDTLNSAVFKLAGLFDEYAAEKRVKIYAISGLGADSRVFKELDLVGEIIPLEWITPKENEAIEEYAMRLAKKIDTDEEFAIMGVSFGGLVATEISKFIHPKYTILLSTVETKDEMRPFFKLVGKHNLDRKLPAEMFDPPKALANFMFGAEKKEHLNAILEDSDPHFSKWAIHEMMNWKNETRVEPVLKISGTKDMVIPAPDVPNIHLIKGTGHFMVVDRANEVSRIINDYILKQQNTEKPNI